MNKYRKIAIIAAWALLIPAVFVVLGFAGISRNNQVCNGVDVKITGIGADSFISGKEILDITTSASGPLTGRKLAGINLHSIETSIRKNPWVADAAVFPTLTGKLCVKAEPRAAGIRIINRWDEQFYIDRKGFMFPVRPGYPARVMVASGNIGTHYIKGQNVNTIPDSVKKISILPSVLYINRYIAGDELLSALIGQIYVNQEGEIELVPVAANHTIIIGDTSNLEKKFGKLIVFYDRILKTKGWDKYKTINLKFENQIVCSK